nr:hypothetical protein [Tanacetum cinerariifolium]
GVYHQKNIDFAYLLSEDFVYQVEHKDAKKSNKMYYPRCSLRSRWSRDIRTHNNLVSCLPIKLTNEDIKNSEAYKEYYAVTSGAAPSKTKASLRKTKSSSDTTTLLQLLQEGNDDASLGLNVGGEEGQDAEDDDEELYRDVNINMEGRDVQMTDVRTTQEYEDTHVTLTLVNPNALIDAYESDKIILDTYGDIVTLKRRRDDAYKDEEPSAGSNRGSKRRREGKEPESTSALKEKVNKTTEKSTQGSKSHQKTASKSAPAEEPMQTTQDLEEPSNQEFETSAADDQPIAEASQHPECDLAKQVDSCSSFNELIDTLVDFSAFLMNRLKLHTLTPELLAGLTYKLMKGSCKSIMELELFLEEVYKATTDQLYWNNPKGQQYPHNMLKPLPLIPNSRGRRVILFDHFINNDLEYHRGGASSCKYKTSISKTKAADYGYIKWIKDLFYGFAVNRESARDVYSKHRIIAVTEFQIIEWHNYKHLDWITAIWRKSDKEGAAAMIQAIDKQLKTKRIM